MNQFGQYPFVRILLPFLAGILSHIYLGWDGPFLLFLFVFLFAVYFTDFLTVNIFGRFAWRIFNGIYLVVLIFLAGILWTGFLDDRKSDFHYSHLPEEARTYQAKIIRDPIVKEKSIKAELQITGYLDRQESKPLKGKVILYLRKSKEALELEYGDELLFHSLLKPIPPPQNPGEFDYRQYCAFHRIYFQGYADESHWKKTGNDGNPVFTFASQSRKKLLSILKSAGLENQEYAVASALILGYTDEIDQQTKTAYSSSGALHVLSVSGLHVAIIFLVFDKMLLFLLYFKNGKYYKAFLILLILWLYALLTGLSPSVMRSAAMLSLVVLGKLMNRNASIYNILCGSAFLLLCIDPLMIMEVGFQLSYLAVLGIVYIHPKVYHLVFFQNKMLDFTWNVTAVSIAAQVATFPLGLLYFHQFPNYFLVSNLIVIPLGTVILYNGILALIFSFVPWLNEALIFTLKWSVRILNESVYWVEQLPYSLSTGISITIFETWIIYLMVICFLFYTDWKKTWLLKFSMMAFIFLFTIFSLEKWNQNQHSELVVYHVKKEKAIDLINGRSHLFLADSSLKNDENKMLFHILHHWDESGIRETYYDQLPEGNQLNGMYAKGNYYGLNDLRMVLIDSTTQIFIAKEKLKVDVVILSGNPKIHLDQIRQMYQFDQIVIAPDNSFYRIQEWKDERRTEEKLHVVSEEGAFIRKV